MDELTAVAERLRELELRLERQLAAGWRSGGDEARELGEEAEALAALGLPELAGRLQRVAAATDARTLLPAVALALSASRLLRARLPAQARPAGAWQPLAATDDKKPARDHLLPVARLAFGGSEVWACVRRRGGMPVEWLLIEPPALEWPSRAAAQGVSGLVKRLMGRATEAGARPAWLTQSLHGLPRWQGRHPLGARAVELCRLEEAHWGEPVKPETLAHFHKAVGGVPRDALMVYSGGGALRLHPVTHEDLARYAWVGPTSELAAEALRQYGAPLWGLIWAKPPEAALALIQPGAALRPARLIHLTPGLPTDALGE